MGSKHLSILSKKKQAKTKKYFKDKDEYEEKLLEVQQLLLGVQQRLYLKKRKVILVFEGPDAAGKGGVIQRFTRYMDPRGIHVHAIGTPNVLELRQNYLQRFFKDFPEPGKISVFDRSWYGRVLVERVEKMIPPKDWKRAYGEINTVEKMLSDDGVLVLKYFLDLTYEEQKNRFEERKKDPLKKWKLTEEDWRNRRKWDLYYPAFHDMLRKTSTEECPWSVIAADSKWTARVKILENILDRTQ